MSQKAKAQSAREFLPESRSLSKLRAAAASCEGCQLYRRATQTVFGEGAKSARLILVGEQPGDQEDLQGHPFVGPAGKLLDDVLEDAGIDRSDAYVTNIVKHFKWTPRGKRRMHSKPNAREISACRPWLEAEIESVEPWAIVCLGATAAQALLGRGFRVTRQRGQIFEFNGDSARWILATYHPSAALRAPDPESRDAIRGMLTDDLRKIARRLREGAR